MCNAVLPDVFCPSAFASWIEQLAAENITDGCGGGNYRSSLPNTRADGGLHRGIVQRASSRRASALRASQTPRGPILPIMPEEPEVETETIREGIREELERQGGGFFKRIALTTALLAALAAIAALRAGATVNEALILRTEAARLQAEASDQWAFFQAKGIKASIEEASRTSWLAIGKEPPPEYAANQKRHGDERKEIEAKAREKEKERDEKITEADRLLHEHHGFANTVAILQVSIALGAVAALTRNRAVWIASLVLGGSGLTLFAVTLLH